MKIPYSPAFALAVLLPVAGLAQDAGEEEASEVTQVREDAGQTVEETRIRGRLSEVKVKPEVGPEYFFQDRGGDGTMSGRGGGEMDSDTNIRTWRFGEW